MMRSTIGSALALLSLLALSALPGCGKPEPAPPASEPGAVPPATVADSPLDGAWRISRVRRTEGVTEYASGPSVQGKAFDLAAFLPEHASELPPIALDHHPAAGILLLTGGGVAGARSIPFPDEIGSAIMPASVAIRAISAGCSEISGVSEIVSFKRGYPGMYARARFVRFEEAQPGDCAARLEEIGKSVAEGRAEPFWKTLAETAAVDLGNIGKLRRASLTDYFQGERIEPSGPTALKYR
jgi:hypothetical protein